MNKNCYLLYGDNHLLIREKTKKIFQQYEVDEDAIEVYDFEETGLHIALSNALTLPFLVEKKGVIIRNASFLTRQGKSTENEVDDLIRFCKMKVSETVLVIQSPYEKLDGQKKIVKFLKKNVISEEYTQKKDFNVYDFIKERLAENGHKIEPFALTQFVNRINHDVDSVNNEIAKLILFAKDKETINSDIVMKITSKDIDESIFNLVNALIDKNKVKLMDIYRDLKEINTSEIFMISTLSNKFMEMLHTKSLLKLGFSQKDIMSYFKVSSGRAYYMKKNAEEISQVQLEGYVSSLADLDFRIKSGKIDKQMGLELFLLKA